MKTLDETLAEILLKVTESMSKGMDFAEDQLPDVVSQLLLWYGAYNFILFMIGMISIPVAYRLFKIPKKGKRLTDTPDGDGDYKYEPNIWYTKWGKADAVIPYWIALAVIETCILIATFNLTWLKVWIAPKIWLIEYAATLVKG